MEKPHDIPSYNRAQTPEFREICEELEKIISDNFPKAESKLWHGGPVWFLDGNPIVGYWARKDSVQLLFWSGQSFDEPGLKPEGTFKAAEKRYTSKDEIDGVGIAGWLKKAEKIQWDYKNIVKRKGVLVKIGKW